MLRQANVLRIWCNLCDWSREYEAGDPLPKTCPGCGDGKWEKAWSGGAPRNFDGSPKR